MPHSAHETLPGVRCPTCGALCMAALVAGWLEPPGWQFWGARHTVQGATGDALFDRGGPLRLAPDGHDPRFIRCTGRLARGTGVLVYRHFRVVVNGASSHRIAYWTER